MAKRTTTTARRRSEVGRAFGVMLDAKRALLEGVIIHTGMPAIKGVHASPSLTIREASEDKAADVIERALREAERRGERRATRRADDMQRRSRRRTWQ